jgi:E3 ubiquitin-protein ligase CHFR
MDSVMDILGNPEVYEAFAVNAVEFDYLLDYLTSKEISPRHIYAEVSLLAVTGISCC